MFHQRFGSPLGVGRRGVVPVGTQLWPDGVIPYDLSKIECKYITNILWISYIKIYFVADEDKVLLLEGMKQLMEDTAAEVAGEVVPCITLRERTPEDETYVEFKYGQGCYTVRNYS